jgi:lipopolysaccharide/colanic/teichoic acid biosynthesis glycosyltransferase
MKRFFDVVGSAAGLLILSPLLSLCAFAVWLEDRRCPFFLGRRVARGGGIFHMVKFRTMVPDAWKSGVNSTAATDYRITRVGRVLRSAKLDELPQLWNVLTGGMSLVGPRPQVETDARLYTTVERQLFAVRPGITDLASIVFADEGEILAGSANPDLLYNQIIRPWKSRLGLLYLDHRSLGVDAAIIFLTVVSAINREFSLAQVQLMLRAWGADAPLIGIASRRDPLAPGEPPGAASIVDHYPGGVTTAAI